MVKITKIYMVEHNYNDGRIQGYFDKKKADEHCARLESERVKSYNDMVKNGIVSADWVNKLLESPKYVVSEYDIIEG